MRHVYFLTGVISIFLLLQSCPSSGSLDLGLDEKIEKVIHWSAEFGYNCALAGLSREDMHRRLREMKEDRK